MEYCSLCYKRADETCKYLFKDKKKFKGGYLCASCIKKHALSKGLNEKEEQHEDSN